MYYILSINTKSGTKRSLRINDPLPGLTKSDLEEAAEDVVNADVFDPAKGQNESINKLEAVTITRESLL